jgi:hypothetical protein
MADRDRSVEDLHVVEVPSVFEPAHRRHNICGLKRDQRCSLAVTLLDTVKIVECTGQVLVSGKCKIVLIDSCRDLSVALVGGAICTVELVNCVDVKINTGNTPLTAIDKCERIAVTVHQSAEIVTASSLGIVLRLALCSDEYTVPSAEELGFQPAGRQCLTVLGAGCLFSTGPFIRYEP